MEALYASSGSPKLKDSSSLPPVRGAPKYTYGRTKRPTQASAVTHSSPFASSSALSSPAIASAETRTTFSTKAKQAPPVLGMRRGTERQQIKAAKAESLADVPASYASTSPNRGRGGRARKAVKKQHSNLSSDEDDLSPPPSPAARRRPSPIVNGHRQPDPDSDEDEDEEIPCLSDIAVAGPSTRPARLASPPPSSKRQNPIDIGSSPLSSVAGTPHKPLARRPSSPSSPSTPSKKQRNGRRMMPVVEIPTRSPPKSSTKSHVSDSSPLSAAPSSLPRLLPSAGVAKGKGKSGVTARERVRSRLNGEEPLPLKRSSSSGEESEKDEGKRRRKSPRKQDKVDYFERVDIGEEDDFQPLQSRTKRATRGSTGADDVSADPLDLLNDADSDLSSAPEELIGSLEALRPTRKAPRLDQKLDVEVGPSETRRGAKAAEKAKEEEGGKRETGAERLRRNGAVPIKRAGGAAAGNSKRHTSEDSDLSSLPPSGRDEDDRKDEDEDNEEEDEDSASDSDEDDEDDFIPTNGKKSRSQPSPSKAKSAKTLRKPRSGRKGSDERDSSPALSEDGLKKAVKAKAEKEVRLAKVKQDATLALFNAMMAEGKKEARDERWAAEQDRSITLTKEHYTRLDEEAELTDPPSADEDEIQLVKQLCGEKIAADRFRGMFQWMIDLYEARKADKLKNVRESADDYCATHRAESRGVFKHGEALGFPDHIDFVEIPRRLETPWIRDRLIAISQNPRGTPSYTRALDRREQLGGKWRARGHKHASTGYYGAPGQIAILNHLNRLDANDRYPTIHPTDAQPTPTCYPFNAEEFKNHVLLPEASVLLIMQDRGFDGSGTDDAYNLAEVEAREVWEKSQEYGKWAWFAIDEGKLQTELVERRDTVDIELPKKLKKKKVKVGLGSASQASAGVQEPENQTIMPPNGQVELHSPSLSPPPPSGQVNGPAKRQRKLSGQGATSRGTPHHPSSADSRSKFESATTGRSESKVAVAAPAETSGRPKRTNSNRSLQKSQSFGDEFEDPGEEVFALVDEAERSSTRQPGRRRK